jgi:hypothetical protein
VGVAVAAPTPANVTVTIFTGSLATTATSSSNVGNYDITEGSLAATGNYSIVSFTGATLIVNPATPNVTFNTPAPLTYGTALANNQVSGSATWTVNGSLVTVAGTYSYSTDAGTVLGAGSHTESVTFTPTDSTDYNPVTGSVIVTVNKATPTVSVSDAGGTYNGNAFPATATVAGLNGVASNSLEGVGLTLDYQQLDSQGNVIQDLGATAPKAAGSYKVTASFAGSTDYIAASSSVTFSIAKATPIFSLVEPPTVIDGTSLTQITGAIVAGSLIPPNNESVTITVNGASYTAAINPTTGTFAVAVPTASLGTGSYTIGYAYAGDNNFNAASATANMDVTNGILAPLQSEPGQEGREHHSHSDRVGDRQQTGHLLRRHHSNRSGHGGHHGHDPHRGEH